MTLYIKVIILFLMIFLHIVNDFNLQGWMAQAKQKSYWNENAPDKKYRYDYIPVLFAHSFSWSFMVMLPITIYLWIISGLDTMLFIFLIFNTVIHAQVDNLKCNKMQINLIIDQTLHMIQIIFTWILLLIV